MAIPFWQQKQKLPKKDSLGRDLDPTAVVKPAAPQPMGTTGSQPNTVSRQPPINQPKNPAFGGNNSGPGSFQPARSPVSPPSQIGQPQAKPVALTPEQQRAVDAARGAQTPAPAPVTYRPVVQKELSPVQPVGDAALQQAINDLLNSDVRDTAAEQQRAREIAAEREGQSVAAQRARAGFGGFGLSGAASVQEADIRRAAAGQLSSDLLGIDAQARGEQQARQLAGVQAGLASAQNDIQRQAWALALKRLEAQYGEDYDGDGVVSGPGEEQQSKEKQSELRSVSAASAGKPLSPSRRKDLEAQGLIFTAVHTDGWNPAHYVDQFGNEYPMTNDDPLNTGWLG